MAKKTQNRKNSRAARRLLDVEPEIDIKTTESKAGDSLDAKARVLTQLAAKEERNATNKPSLDSELLAISRGSHPGQKSSVITGKVSKQGKKTKKDKKKQERAEMVKDMLSEKITLANRRHKTIKEYRKKDDEEAEEL